MRALRLYFVCLSFILTFGQLPSQETLALLEFKKGIQKDPTRFVLDSWNDESINLEGCPSSWNGIMCSGGPSGNVVGIALNNLGLSGNVNLNVLANLTMLVKLSISNNSISGKLPDSLSMFKQLEYLDISDNKFSGALPSDIGELVNLQNISLSGNNVSGSIPDTISGLASIRSLDLSRNSLSGSLPLSLASMVETQLDVLDLHDNMLEGELDPKFLLHTTASYVDLSGNMLVSSSKDQQKFLGGISPSVKHLNLSHNQLTGSLVGVVMFLGSLKVLDLSYNQLSGELPGFTFVYDLQVLKLSNNMFSGAIPNDLLKGEPLVLTDLDLSGNNLSGPLSMITSTTLHTLNLSSNMLSGELPILTGSCAVIDLSNNQLEGSLTRMLKWGEIEILDLSQNRLEGSIPEVTAQFLRLNYLNLSHNSLNGSLPKVITLFTKLSKLDLSYNQFDGPLLTTLLMSPTLEELHLHGNKLLGSIDFADSSSDSNLQVLDLSNNQINGQFPEGLGSFIKLQVLNTGDNDFVGSLPASLCNLTALNSLDISRNHFNGPLPNNLSTNLQSFNASYNNLSGVVPDNLRKFSLSSFYPGNSQLQFPNPPTGSNNGPSENASKKHLRTIIKVMIIVSCVVAFVILIILIIVVYFKHKSKRHLPQVTGKDVVPQVSTSSFSGRDRIGGWAVSAGDNVASQKGSVSEVVSLDEKMGAVTGFSLSKKSNVSWSPESGDSYTAESLSRLEVRSPDQLVGELYFLDDTISFTAEELSKAPAEVLGRSNHGTSYKATLENGLVVTIKWLREGVAKQRKEFAKEAKKFANIRHPNVVGLRGYYWGPTQHEKLILSDYISPGNLCGFLYDLPGRKVPPLTWAQRLKIAVDVARGLNYLHFDRALPHGNLKATNILLDGPDLNARVDGYCLHRLMTQTGTLEQILDAGVLGYRAPELASSKKAIPSFKSDVYAFGVILLELLTGKCASDVVSSADGGVNLTDWVRLRVAQGRGSDCFDAALAQETSTPAVDRGTKEVLGVALRCVRSVSERPGIKTVYEDLSSI